MRVSNYACQQLFDKRPRQQHAKLRRSLAGADLIGILSRENDKNCPQENLEIHE